MITSIPQNVLSKQMTDSTKREVQNLAIQIQLFSYDGEQNIGNSKG